MLNAPYLQRRLQLTRLGPFLGTSQHAIVTSRREAVIAWRTKHGRIQAAVYRFSSPHRR